MGRLSTDNRLIAERDLLAGVADTSEARILVVDDDDSVRVILRNLLIKLGFTCETARDGMEALDRLKADAYDIVLADIRMPVMDGMTMLEKIKSIHPDTDVIMMTGYGFAYTFMDVLEKGATDFITKPVNHLELKARINRILRERQLKGYSEPDGKSMAYLSLFWTWTASRNATIRLVIFKGIRFWFPSGRFCSLTFARMWTALIDWAGMNLQLFWWKPVSSKLV
jgi:DNA-binding response OmpR family regulator